MLPWRAIILAGGSGSRLYPLTVSVSKQLLPVYDKPMIYYPLATLLQAGIRDIAIITVPDQQPLFQRLLGSGQQWGCHFTYVVQEKPLGLAQAFLLCKDFIRGFNTCLILGDNLFWGGRLPQLMQQAVQRTSGATVFGRYVSDPERYGVVWFDQQQRVLGIEEKPAVPPSHYAVTGLYFYDTQVLDIAQSLRPSARGELEITDVNRAYLERGRLHVELLGEDTAWFDTGTHDSLFDAAGFVRTQQNAGHTPVACLEQIALDRGYISTRPAPGADSDDGQPLQNLLGD